MELENENSNAGLLEAKVDANGEVPLEQHNEIVGGAGPNGQKPTSDYISKADVAVRLGKSVRTVEYWMHIGYIPHIKLGKGRRATVLFKWADIESHLKNHYGIGFKSDF